MDKYIDLFINNQILSLDLLLATIVGITIGTLFTNSYRLLHKGSYRYRRILGLIYLGWGIVITEFVIQCLPLPIKSLTLIKTITASGDLGIIAGFVFLVLELVRGNKLPKPHYYVTFAIIAANLILQVLLHNVALMIIEISLAIVASTVVAVYGFVNLIHYNKSLANEYTNFEHLSLRWLGKVLPGLWGILLYWVVIHIFPIIIPTLQTHTYLVLTSVGYCLLMIFVTNYLSHYLINHVRIPIGEIEGEVTADKLPPLPDQSETTSASEIDLTEEHPQAYTDDLDKDLREQAPAIIEERPEASMKDTPDSKSNEALLSAQVLEMCKGFDTEIRRRAYYRNPDITLQGLATLLGTNRTYLSFYVNQVHNCNFSEYINSMRVEFVVKAITKDPYAKLDEVSARAGFRSKSTFLRAFQKNVGESPASFQQKAKGNR